MLSHPSRITAAISPTRPRVRSTRGLLLGCGAALALIALGTRAASEPVEGAADIPVTSTSSVPSAPALISGTGCWITGDLVGEGNPADLAAAFCGRK